jgi:hypothetical protein
VLLLLLLLSLLVLLLAVVKAVCRVSVYDAAVGAQQQSNSCRSAAARLAEASACEESSASGSHRSSAWSTETLKTRDVT